MVVINDPVTGEALRITDSNRLQAEAEASSRQFFISRDIGQVYHGILEDAGATANEEILYLRNASTTKLLFIGQVTISTDTAAKFRIKKVTGTATGSDVVPENLNSTSANAADVEFKGNGAVTGLTDDGDVFVGRVSADNSFVTEFGDALILGQNNAIAIETETTASIDITIDFHLE